MRDLAIFNLAIDSKLRACDLVKLRLDDILLGGVDPETQSGLPESCFRGRALPLQMPVEAKVP